jgi:hypothetical protein
MYGSRCGAIPADLSRCIRLLHRRGAPAEETPECMQWRWIGDVRSATCWQRRHSNKATFTHSRERVGRGSEISLSAMLSSFSTRPAPVRRSHLPQSDQSACRREGPCSLSPVKHLPPQVFDMELRRLSRLVRCAHRGMTHGPRGHRRPSIDRNMDDRSRGRPDSRPSARSSCRQRVAPSRPFGTGADATAAVNLPC